MHNPRELELSHLKQKLLKNYLSLLLFYAYFEFQRKCPTFDHSHDNIKIFRALVKFDAALKLGRDSQKFPIVENVISLALGIVFLYNFDGLSLEKGE